MRLDFIYKLDYKRSIRISKVGIKYSMRDLICNVIKYCDKAIWCQRSTDVI